MNQELMVEEDFGERMSAPEKDTDVYSLRGGDGAPFRVVKSRGFAYYASSSDYGLTAGEIVGKVMTSKLRRVQDYERAITGLNEEITQLKFLLATTEEATDAD